MPDAVVIVEHGPDRPMMYIGEASRLGPALPPGPIPATEHSAAPRSPGMVAKPVIDVRSVPGARALALVVNGGARPRILGGRSPQGPPPLRQGSAVRTHPPRSHDGTGRGGMVAPAVPRPPARPSRRDRASREPQTRHGTSPTGRHSPQRSRVGGCRRREGQGSALDRARGPQPLDSPILPGVGVQRRSLRRNPGAPPLAIIPACGTSARSCRPRRPRRTWRGPCP